MKYSSICKTVECSGVCIVRGGKSDNIFFDSIIVKDNYVNLFLDGKFSFAFHLSHFSLKYICRPFGYKCYEFIRKSY